MSVGREAWFFNGFWCGYLERGWGWGFLFDGIWARVFGVVEALVFVMSRSHDATVRASVERAVFSVVSEMIALGAKASFSMFHWCFFKS